jgi:hypothetical protein
MLIKKIYQKKNEKGGIWGAETLFFFPPPNLSGDADRRMVSVDVKMRNDWVCEWAMMKR